MSWRGPGDRPTPTTGGRPAKVWFKKPAPEADPSRMRHSDDSGSSIDGDLFGLVAEEIAAPPPPLGTPDEQRRLLLAELRELIEADAYEVDPNAVAESIIDKSLGFIDWRD